MAYGPDSIRVVIPETHAIYFENIQKESISAFPDKGSRLVNSLELLNKVRVEIKHYRPDVLHLHSFFAGFSVRPSLIFYRNKPKVLYCPHAWAFKRYASPMVTIFTKTVENLLSHFCDAIVCTSRCEYDSAVKIGIDKHMLKLIFNGLSSNVPSPPDQAVWPEGRLKLLFVGRFDRQKGIDLFMDAIGQLQDVAFAYVVGEPVVHGDSSRITQVPDNVALVGWQKRDMLQAFYSSADALVMPSRWEGFGLVAAEAMRAGLAVIASRIGSLNDVVEDSVTGILFEPDSSSAIVDAIRSVDSRTLARMGKAGQERFNRMFTSERMFADMHALYERITG